MSIDVKDFRRHNKVEKDEPKTPLLEQVPAPEIGDTRLDKLSRVLTSFLERDDKHANEVALKGIGCVQDDMLKLQQFEFFYTKGKCDAWNEALKVPERILAEERGFLQPETAAIQ